MKLQVSRKVTIKSVVAGFLFVASVAGFDFKDWNPTNPHELIHVGVIFALGIVIAYVGINTQDPSSEIFVKDALSIFQQVLAAHPDVLKPEVKQAMQAKLDDAKPGEKPADLK